MRWNIAESGNQKKSERKDGFGLEWWGGVNDSSDKRSGTRKFEGRMFEGRSVRNGDGGCFNVLSVYSCNTSSVYVKLGGVVWFNEK